MSGRKGFAHTFAKAHIVKSADLAGTHNLLNSVASLVKLPCTQPTIAHVQRARKRFANLAKQDPGRAMQKSLSKSRTTILPTTYKLSPGPPYTF